MVITPSGLNGLSVLQRAVEGSIHEKETAPIPLRNTEEETAGGWALLWRHSHAARENAVSTKLCLFVCLFVSLFVFSFSSDWFSYFVCITVAFIFTEEFKSRDRYNVEWLNFVYYISAGQTSLLQVQLWEFTLEGCFICSDRGILRNTGNKKNTGNT